MIIYGHSRILSVPDYLHIKELSKNCMLFVTFERLVRLALVAPREFSSQRMNVTNCFPLSPNGNYIIRNDPILQQQIDFDSALPNDELFN